MGTVVVQATAVSFFRGALSDALSRECVSVDPLAETYVATLLVRSTTRTYDPDQAISDRFAFALAADRHRQVSLLAEVGDTALLFSGVWWAYHHSPRRISHNALYLQLGPKAYRLIGGATFDELSKKFEGVACALKRFGMEHSLVEFRDVLHLYAKWQQTGDARIARVLAGQGIFVSSSGSKAPS